VHFEIDIQDPTRSIPVGTTGEVRIEVGTPIPATELPLYAATIRGEKANVFTVEQGVARQQTVAVNGESGGSLFLNTALAPGTLVVTEGRALLEDGDQIEAKEVVEGGDKPGVSSPQLLPGESRRKGMGGRTVAREAP
jgi:hypothetical protein